MAVIQKTFALTGGREGQTVQLGDYTFIEGRITLVQSEEDMAQHAKFLELNWAVKEVEGEAPVVVKKEPETLVPDPNADFGGRLRKAINDLDPDDDAHWTAEGKPAIAAVTSLYGSTGVTRADVEAAAPGFNRTAAQEARDAAGQE